jgi:hypothetical protein
MSAEAHDLGDGVRAFVIRSEEEFVSFLVAQTGLEVEEAQPIAGQRMEFHQQAMLVMFIHSDVDRTFSRVLMPLPKGKNTVVWGLVETGDTDVGEDISSVPVPFSSDRVLFERDDKIFREVYDDGFELPDPRLMNEIPRTAKRPGYGLE